jgi:hypothetical protein
LDTNGLPKWLHFSVNGATTFSKTTLGIMTSSILVLIVTLSVMTLGMSIKCHYAERGVLFAVMLNVVMLSVVAPRELILRGWVHSRRVTIYFFIF